MVDSGSGLADLWGIKMVEKNTVLRALIQEGHFQLSFTLSKELEFLMSLEHSV